MLFKARLWIQITLMSYSDAMRDSDLTTDELETAFESLKGNKAAGIDTINSIMIF